MIVNPDVDIYASWKKRKHAEKRKKTTIYWKPK